MTDGWPRSVKPNPEQVTHPKRLRQLTTMGALTAEINRYNRSTGTRNERTRSEFETRKAEEAYRQALAFVKAARFKGYRRIDFSGLPALAQIPTTHALTKLFWLDFDFTEVSELSPLTAVTVLQWLQLVPTQVSYLRPLTALTSSRSVQRCFSSRA